MACAVEYNLRKFSLGESKSGPGKLGYGLTCQVPTAAHGGRKEGWVV